MELAPIVIFAYNRLHHTQQTVNALLANDLSQESEVIFFIDGPKPDASEEERKAINQVSNYCKQVSGFKKVEVNKRTKNQGLGNSITKGLDQVFRKHTTAIVLEDDLVTGEGFLRYMNESLSAYSNHANVYSITGYMFPIDFDDSSVFLLPYISTWGWATWRNKWNSFSWNLEEAVQIQNNRIIQDRFNLADYDYTKMLSLSPNQSWGIHWYLSVFLRNGLSVFPTKSLIKNIGGDNSGTNTTTDTNFDVNFVESHSVDFQDTIDLKKLALFLSYFKNRKHQYKRTIHVKIKEAFKSLFR